MNYIRLSAALPVQDELMVKVQPNRHCSEEIGAGLCTLRSRLVRLRPQLNPILRQHGGLDHFSVNSPNKVSPRACPIAQISSRCAGFRTGKWPASARHLRVLRTDCNIDVRERSKSERAWVYSIWLHKHICYLSRSHMLPTPALLNTSSVQYSGRASA